MKVIYKCSFCEKEIISPKEDENLMFFCSDHFKYTCKNCEKVVGKCAECGKVPCKACNFFGKACNFFEKNIAIPV
jgi:hypothetical protein